jgi:hypothetical protein
MLTAYSPAGSSVVKNAAGCRKRFFGNRPILRGVACLQGLTGKTHALLKRIFPSIGDQGFYLAEVAGSADRPPGLGRPGHNQPFASSASSLSFGQVENSEDLTEVQTLIADLEG